MNGCVLEIVMKFIQYLYIFSTTNRNAPSVLVATLAPSRSRIAETAHLYPDVWCIKRCASAGAGAHAHASIVLLLLYFDSRAMKRTPYSSNTLIYTCDRLCDLLELFSVGISQQFHLFPHLFGAHFSHADRLSSSVDVMSNYDGMLPWSRGDGNLNLWVSSCKSLEICIEKRIHAS